MDNLPKKEELQEYYKKSFWSDLLTILKPRPKPSSKIERVLLLLGCLCFLLPILALWGFVFAYNRLGLRYKRVDPELAGKPKAVYATMVFFALGIPLILFALFLLGIILVKALGHAGTFFIALFIWIIINHLLTNLFMGFFSAWQAGIYNYFSETSRVGSARFADGNDLAPYTRNQSGLYFGLGYLYTAPGHMLTVAGTRGGKGVNLILNNLLGMGNYKGSWIVLDPKGENAAVSGRYQKSIGQEVVHLNPWGLLDLPETGFNPLDTLDANSENLVDDIQLISEALVPIDNSESSNSSEYFNSTARAYITGLLLHLVTSDEPNKSLETLWKWLRLGQKELKELIADMCVNESEHAGEVISATGYSMANLMGGSDKEFSSVMSSAQKWTNFLSSPALRRSLRSSDFDPLSIAEGHMTIYVMIPPDRLKTHYQWLRLVMGILMKVVVRKPNEKVTFLLDEAAAIGYLSEIETALGAYAGYNITVWSIFQDLNQIKRLYKHGWETFMGNCSLKNFFNISDNFSGDYLSKMFGQTSIPSYSAGAGGKHISGASGRQLVTADELRRNSGTTMYTLVDQCPVAEIPKLPYFKALQEGTHYDLNPYFKG